jgi:hypothetical protein
MLLMGYAFGRFNAAAIDHSAGVLPIGPVARICVIMRARPLVG